MAFLAFLPCGGYAGEVHSDDSADPSGKLDGEHFVLSGFPLHLIARRVKGMDLEEKLDPLHALRNLGKGVGQARIA